MPTDPLKKIAGLIRRLQTLSGPDGLAGALVFGSAALVLRGVDLGREPDDLDIFVSPAGYARLEKIAVGRAEKAPGVAALQLAPGIEALDAFPGVAYADAWRGAAPLPGSCGLPVASLDTLIAWKRAQGRDKDRRDLAIIETHLTRTALR